MLKIQEFISCFDSTLEAYQYLRSNLNIDVSIHTLEDGDVKHNVALLRPGQRADLTNPLVREANCLILDDYADLFAKAWDRPYVASEAGQLPDDFCLPEATCEEVPDGELVVIYNVEGTWFIGTAESVDGMNYLPGMNVPTFTYDNEIKQRLSRNSTRWDSTLKDMNPLMCLVFNFVSPFADSVMPMLMPELYLTGVINLENGREVSNSMLHTIADKMGVARPRWSEINGASSLAQRIFSMRALAPGLMLRDKNDKRVFIPNPIHKAVRCAKESGDRVRPTHIAKILQTCRDKADVTTITAAYDSYAPMLELLQKVRSDLIKEVLILWGVARHKVSAADFASTINHHPLKYILFMRRNEGAVSLRTEVNSIKPIKLTRIAENKWEKEYVSASKLLKFAGGTNGDSETS